MSEKMKILIAYDGSDCANAALEDLQRAGLPRVAEALIMSVAEVFLPPSSSPAPALPAEVPVAVQRAWAQATHAVDDARALAAARTDASLALLSCLGGAGGGVCRLPCLGSGQKSGYLVTRSPCGGIPRPLRSGSFLARERIAEDPHRGSVLGTGGTEPPPDECDPCAPAHRG
jgi:hypothetical protein